MLAVIASVIVVFLLLLASELWWRHRGVKGEFSRKFIHVTVGSFTAFWPFFMSWNSIRFLSFAFLVVVAASKYLGFFKAIHSVQRPTWGELFFAVVAGSITFITHDKWIFAAALLQMSLADGLAAVIGVRFAGRHQYKVFGHVKSYIGSTAFLCSSVLILLGYVHFSRHVLPTTRLLTIAAAATAIENLGVRGSDNLLVPLVAAILLRL